MLRFVAAFTAIYVIWGSTYLAIKLAIATLPPFLMLSFRFTPAGLLLYAFLRLRGLPAPTRHEWIAAAGVGTLMLAGGTGAVAWAERSIHSGLAALLVAAVPMWMVLFDWLGPARRRPTRRVLVGLAIGFLGVTLIVGPAWEGAGLAGLGAVLVVMFGTICWALGSVYSRYLTLPGSSFMASAAEMITAGIALFVLALLFGDLSAFDPAAVSRESALSVAYLIVFGSLVAYAAYVWLLHNTTPARVSSYAFVNPLVAMMLGVWLGDESFGPLALAAAALVVASVALITLEVRPPERPEEPIECGGRQSA
ncbi:MAG: EamA family transporter [Gemmatimonadota bacterium]